MSPHDGDLEDALRDAFRAHEYLAEGQQPNWAPPPRAPRSRTRVVAAVAASTLIAATVGLVYETHGGPEPTPGTPVTRPTHDPHIAATRRWVSDTLSRAPVPPGAQRRDRAPVAQLDWDQPLPADWNTLTATRWFLAPGTVDQATTYLLAHPPTGLTWNGGTGSVTVYPDGRQVHQLTFNDRQDRNAAYTGAQVTTSLFDTPTGVAIRIDVEAVWLATRGPNTQVPFPVLSVELVHQSESGHSASRTVTGPDADALAHLVNAARAANPRPRLCPAETAVPDSARLIFHSSARTTTVVIRLGGCPAAFVQIDGQTQTPAIEETETLRAAVARLLPGHA